MSSSAEDPENSIDFDARQPESTSPSRKPRHIWSHAESLIALRSYQSHGGCTAKPHERGNLWRDVFADLRKHNRHEIVSPRAVRDHITQLLKDFREGTLKPSADEAAVELKAKLTEVCQRQTEHLKTRKIKVNLNDAEKKQCKTLHRWSEEETLIALRSFRARNGYTAVNQQRGILWGSILQDLREKGMPIVSARAVRDYVTKLLRDFRKENPGLERNTGSRWNATMEVLLEICQLEEGRGDVADDICGDSTAVGTGGRKRNHEAPVQPKTIARALKERNFSRLYCPDCDVFLDKACPVHSQRVCDAPVIPLAIASLPSVLEFISFGISGLPTGVQAKSAIPKLTVFGPLRGVIAHDLEKKDSLSTTWSGQENEPVYALPDLNGDCVRRIKMDSVHTCNWLKFVRRAADAREHNLAVYETNGEIYFLTIRPLAPGEELKFWYSQKYAQSIGLCDSVPDPHDKARVVPPKFKKIYSFESTLPANLPDDDDNSGAFVEEFLGDGGSGIESSDSADLAPTTSRNSEWIDEKDKDEDVSMEADQEEEKDVPHNPPGEGGRPIKSRHKWSREETTAALRLYIAYGGCGLESRDTANRDTLWQNIYNDLIAARFKITSVRAVRERMLNVMKKFQTDMSNEKDIVLDSVGELLREIFQLRKESRRQLKINKNPEAGEEAETITQHSPDQINVKKCRHRWSKEETLAALQLYCTHEGYRVGANRAGLWQRIYDGLIGANFRIISPRAVREHVFKLMASSQTDDEGTALDATGEMLRKIRQLEKDSENEAANKKQQRLEKMNASAAASTSGPKKRRFYPKPRTMLPPTETVYPCLECLVSFTSEKLLEIHNLGHNTADTAKWDQSDGIVCPECQKTFESIVSLIAHIMEHKKVYAPRVQCAQCHRYIAAQFLARHMREMHPSEAGTTSNVCDECGEEFPTPRRLAFHIKGMHSAKPCAICAKMFYTWVELGQHALSHQQPDGYHCPQCSFICPTYTKLARHVANYHDVRNLTCCPVCNMMFTSRNRLNGHMRNHAEGFQHDCGLCGKSFRTRSTLQYHKRWSHGTQLKEKFRRLKEKAPARDYTAPRKRMRFEEFTYKCEECRFGFMTEGRWLRHKEKFHYDGADVPST